MAKTDGSTIDKLNERIDLVADLLIASKSKGEIKKVLKAKFRVGFRTVENDIVKAHQRLLEEDSLIDFAVGLVNRLHGSVRIGRELASEHGIVSKRSASRIIDSALVQRDKNAQVIGAEAKAQIVEALRQIVRDTDDDRVRISALQQIASLLGLERIKIDLTVNEEKEIDAMIADEIAALRSSGRQRTQLLETSGNGNGRK